MSDSRPAVIVFCLTSIIGGVFLVACASGLNRSSAARLISEFPEFSAPVTGDVRLGEVYVMGLLGEDQRLYEAMQKAGYLTVGNQRDPLMHSANLTEKGKKEAAGWATEKALVGEYHKVPYAKRELIEVSGLSEPKEGMNVVQAKFTWRLVPANDIGKEMSLDASVVEGDAVLQKFDDGWRVIGIMGRDLQPPARLF